MENNNKKNSSIRKLKTSASIAKNDEYFTPDEAVYPRREKKIILSIYYKR